MQWKVFKETIFAKKGGFHDNFLKKTQKFQNIYYRAQVDAKDKNYLFANN